MSPISLIFEFLTTAIAAGLIATAAMVLVMAAITQFGITNADMVRAIGSLFTRSLDTARTVGSFIHFTAGVVFAFLYILAFQLIGVEGALTMIAGTVLGFAHGFVMSFILVTSVAEHHPLEQFRKAGFAVAAAHFIGHGVYGFAIGAVVAAIGFSTQDFGQQLVAEKPELCSAAVADAKADSTPVTESSKVALNANE